MKAKNTISQEQDFLDRFTYLRNRWVMLNSDLEELYALEPGTLEGWVYQFPEHFPADMQFSLNSSEWTAYRKGTVNPAKGPSGPWRAFTIQGITMISSLLSADLNLKVTQPIIRAYGHRYGLHQNDALKNLHHQISKLERQQDDLIGQVQLVLKALVEARQNASRP